MSINNIENIAFNYLTNLTTINADEVNTDILTKSDPDISDLQFDMLEGINTNQTIQQQIDAIENQIVGLGASYWISVWDTTTQTNPAANTARVVTWNNSDPSSNGIVAGASSGSIKVLHANVYNIQFSFQLHQTSSSTANVTIWLRKNGVDVPASAGEYDVKGNDHIVTAWNYVLPLAANDYITLYWASDSTSMTLGYQAAQTSPYAHPAIPSVIITVTNVTGEGAAGPAGPVGPQGPQGERGPRGFKGEAGSGSVDDVARALAGSALALATTAQATAILAQSTAAGAVTANAAQDIVIGALQDAVGTLQTKTQDMSWGTLTGTTFSRTVHVNNTGGGIGGDAVTLSSSEPAQFLYGINNLKVTNSLSVDDYLYVSRNNRNAKKIVLYDGNSGDDYDYTGMWVNSSGTANKFNFEIDNDAGSNFGWYAGNGFGSGRSLLKEISSTREFSTVGEAVFLRQNAFTQNVRLVRDVSNSIVQMTMMGDKAGLGDYDGRIIQLEGNGVTDGTGTMTIESGTININSLVADTVITSNAKVNINADDEINIAATSILGSINLSTDTSDISLTAAGKITGVAGNEITLTSNRASFPAVIITTNTAVEDIVLTNATTNHFEVNSTGQLTVSTTDALNLNGGTDVNMTATTGGVVITSTVGTASITGNTGATIEADSGITAVRNTNGDIDILSYGNTEMTNGSFALVSSSTAEFEATSNILIASNSGNVAINAETGAAITAFTGNAVMTATTGNTNLNATAGEINIQANNNVSIGSNAGNVGIDAVSFDAAVTTGNVLLQTNSGNITLSTVSGTGAINLQSNNGDVNVTATDIDINATTGGMLIRTGTGAIDVHAKANLDLHADTGDVDIYATDLAIYSTSGVVGITGAAGAGFQTTDGNLTVLAGGSANTLFLSSEGETIITSQAGDLILNANSSSYNLTMKVNNSTKLNMNTTTTTHSQNVQMNNNLTMASTSQFNFIPAGTIHMSVASAVPTGYLRCNGNAVSRSTYSVLFAAIGTTFGAGDGITTFNVPNFEGAFLRGQGNQTVGGVNYAAAAIGTAQQDQVLQTTVYATNEGFRDCAAGARECVARRRITADPVDTDTGILAQFQRQGTENRPMNYAVHYNIKF
jgi:microcystin-dependent protein